MEDFMAVIVASDYPVPARGCNHTTQLNPNTTLIRGNRAVSIRLGEAAAQSSGNFHYQVLTPASAWWCATRTTRRGAMNLDTFTKARGKNCYAVAVRLLLHLLYLHCANSEKKVME